MRILVAAQQANECHAIPRYQFWAPTFHNGLAEAGHECVEIGEVDWAEGLVHGEPEDHRAWREHAWARAVDFIRRTHRQTPIDLFLGYFFPRQVDPEALEEVRSLGIPVLNFFCDNVREFTAVPPEFHGFDMHWVPEAGALEMYRRAGLRHLHAPMPTWVPVECRTPDHRERHGPTFVGARDAQRERLFAEAIARGASIELRGAGWGQSPAGHHPAPAAGRWARQVEFLRREGVIPLSRKATERLRSRIPDRVFRGHVRESPTPDEYPRVLQESRVTLGVNRYPSFRHPFRRPGRYSRLRDIEAPMLGACYLTERADGLEELYVLGEEIELYDSAEELAAKIEALERDPARRRRLRAAGQRRALSDHTIGRTMERVACALGISP